MKHFLQTVKEIFFEVSFAIGAICLFFIFILIIIWIIWYFTDDRRKIDKQIERESLEREARNDFRIHHFNKQEPWMTN